MKIYTIICHIILILILGVIFTAPFILLPIDRIIDSIICSLPFGSCIGVMIFSLILTIRGEI